MEANSAALNALDALTNQQDANGMTATGQSEAPVPKQFRSIDHNEMLD